MSSLLSPTARLRVVLRQEQGVSETVCAIAAAPRGLTALEWTPASLASGDDLGANLAVRQAPHVVGVHVVGERSLAGLPGFLADSLPDSWGRLLLDRRLRQLGYVPSAITGLGRLAIVGARGPGALSYEPEHPLPAHDERCLDLDRLARDAELLLAGQEPDLLACLERAGGSAGGSRPKAWIAVGPDGRLRSGAHELADDEAGWLVKFRAPAHDPPDVAAMELAYARMARAAGLDVAEPRLFETSSGRYFASRRFDREGSRRVHVLTVAGLLGVAPHQAVAADYVDLLKLTRHVTRSEAQVDVAYRHAVFNVYAHNRDDHLKQFAFLRRGGAWERAPVYDVTFSEGPAGEHTLLVAGEGRRPTEEHLVRLARSAGVRSRRAAGIRDEVREAVQQWGRHADEAGVGPATRAAVQLAIDDAG